jgi:hypothetical protein
MCLSLSVIEVLIYNVYAVKPNEEAPVYISSVISLKIVVASKES